jgi:photosystem II stability/assembly factor-like uncharacterized protein
MSYIIGGTSFKEGHFSEFKTDGSGSNQIKENKYFELSDIDRVDSNTFYISGYGAILKSVDGGLTWDFTHAKNDFFKAMTWKNAQEGIAVGYEGSIVKTIDGGQTWKVIRNGNSITKKKIHFWDVERNQQQTLVAVGDGGAVFLSVDEGTTWTEVSSNTTQDLRGVFFRNDASCFVVGDHGTVFEIRF